MGRYSRIENATFGDLALANPLSVRISRRAQAHVSGGDGEAFSTSVQIDRPTIAAEIRIRDIKAADGLSLGSQGDLSFTVGASRDGGTPRTVCLEGAVLTSVELAYEQSAMATAVLRFLAESADGASDPFSAEDAS